MRGLNYSYIRALVISFVINNVILYKGVDPKCHYFVSDFSSNMPILDDLSEAYRDRSQCHHKTMRHAVAEH